MKDLTRCIVIVYATIMNPEAQAELKKILAKEIPELTPSDIAFMKARIAYIGKNSRAKFAEVLAETPQKPQDQKKKEVGQDTKQEKKIDPHAFSDDEDEDEDIIDPTTGLSTTDHEDDDEE